MVGFWIFMIVLIICITIVICVFLNCAEGLKIYDVKIGMREINRRLYDIESTLAEQLKDDVE